MWPDQTARARRLIRTLHQRFGIVPKVNSTVERALANAYKEGFEEGVTFLARVIERVDRKPKRRAPRGQKSQKQLVRDLNGMRSALQQSFLLVLAAKKEASRLLNEFEAIKKGLGEHAIVVREGAGPEAVEASVAVSIVSLLRKYKKLEEELEKLRKRDTCVHCGASLLPPDAHPHCLDCVVTEEDEERADAASNG